MHIFKVDIAIFVEFDQLVVHGHGWAVGWRWWQPDMVVVEVAMVKEEQGAEHKRGRNKCRST